MVWVLGVSLGTHHQVWCHWNMTEICLASQQKQFLKVESCVSCNLRELLFWCAFLLKVAMTELREPELVVRFLAMRHESSKKRMRLSEADKFSYFGADLYVEAYLSSKCDAFYAFEFWSGGCDSSCPVWWMRILVRLLSTLVVCVWKWFWGLIHWVMSEIVYCLLRFHTGKVDLWLSEVFDKYFVLSVGLQWSIHAETGLKWFWWKRDLDRQTRFGSTMYLSAQKIGNTKDMWQWR